MKVKLVGTPQGYWVLDRYDYRYRDSMSQEEIKRARRWVPKQGGRFCSDKIEHALYSFTRRKSEQRKKLEWQLQQCKQAQLGLEELGAGPFPLTGLNCGTPFEWVGLRWE